MDFSSRDTLLKIFDEIIEWRMSQRDNFNWTQHHLSVVRSHILKLRLNTNIRLWTSAEMFNDINIMAFFIQELQDLFMVPRLDQLCNNDYTVNKNDIMAAFIDFLLQLLYHKTDFVLTFHDRVHKLEKDLKFFLTVLGDTILIHNEDEDVQNLLAEFEAVTNKAGSLVHTLFFAIHPVFQTMDDGFAILSIDIELLKENISQFTFLQQIIVKANPTRKMASVDSLFIVDSVVNDLEDLLNQDNSLIADVRGQIKILHQDLMFSASSLKDIRVNQFLEMEEVKEAGTRIRDVAYEAEYLISSFLVGNAPLWYLSVRLPDVIHKSKRIKTQIQELENIFDIGTLKGADDFISQSSSQADRNFEVDDITVGFEENAIDILDKLVGGSKQLETIFIFGMAGLGKTTFATKLYNHPSLNYRFDKRSWCVVSQTYQRRSLLADILTSSTSELDKDRILNMEEERLVEHIYKSLKGRRYLVVIDDIWDSNAWDDFRTCFPDDGNGSRILFTSRNKEVAPHNSQIYQLPYLSSDQCWELLEKKVFVNKSCPPHLLGTGKEIAENCYGLPLAVVLIAGILSTMDDERSSWQEVGENVASYISDGVDNHMMQILELSYKHLPQHLKPCFLYFGVFPEDTEILARKLMRLWIAEGFILKQQGKSSEKVAEEYLIELIDRNMAILCTRRSNGGPKSCIVHDLLREFCLKRAGKENFMRLVDDNNNPICVKAHHLLALGPWVAPFVQHVRSCHGGGHLPDSPFYVFNMTLLRVVDFIRWIRVHDMIGIEFLVNLRYLVIAELPPSISSLVNLEFLVVQTTFEVKISSVLLKLMKLRSLHLFILAGYDEDCNVSQTNNLEFLSNVSIFNLKDEEMLKCSPQLRRLRCNCSLLLDLEKKEFRYPDFGFFTQLESLHLTAAPLPLKVHINFPSTIKKLTLSHLSMPWEMMSMIGGLPSLEVLKLENYAFSGETWDTKDDEFQQLIFLKLYKLDLEQWNIESADHFPKLKRLVLFDCFNMQEIPREIGDITTLQLIEVRGWCLRPLLDSAAQIEQDQRDMGNEQLRVLFS